MFLLNRDAWKRLQYPRWPADGARSVLNTGLKSYLNSKVNIKDHMQVKFWSDLPVVNNINCFVMSITAWILKGLSQSTRLFNLPKHFRGPGSLMNMHVCLKMNYTSESFKFTTWACDHILSVFTFPYPFVHPECFHTYQCTSRRFAGLFESLTVQL